MDHFFFSVVFFSDRETKTPRFQQRTNKQINKTNAHSKHTRW